MFDLEDMMNMNPASEKEAIEYRTESSAYNNDGLNYIDVKCMYGHNGSA